MMNTMLSTQRVSDLPEILRSHEQVILAEWIGEMNKSTRRADLIKDSQIQTQCAEFLHSLRGAIETNRDFRSSTWEGVREMLGDISRSRAQQGFSPSETATFIFSMKRPLFSQIRAAYDGDTETLAAEMWYATELLDGLGLFTTEVYQKSREDVIRRQAEGLLELSTPVVKLWNGILALPIIGTMDSARTQMAMESLLGAIVRSDSRVAIIDISGVPIVDTVVAQHLLKTVTAARLMGADCIISGLRPQIAQTIVHLGIDLGNITTKASLSEAFKVALQLVGLRIGGKSTA